MNEFEPGFWKGKYLLFEDRGKLNQNAKTHVYRVLARAGDQILGHVKWMTFWRKYCFFTNHVVLDDGCMEELIEFIKERTTEYKETWKKQSIVDWDKVKEYDQNIDSRKESEVTQVRS